MTLPATLQTLTMKVVTTFYRRLYILSKSTDTIVDAQPNFATHVRPLTEAEVDLYLAVEPNHRLQDFVAGYARGDKCFAIFTDDRIVHLGWATTTHTYLHYLNRILELPPQAIYQYHTYTVPEYRGHRLANMRNAFVLRYYRSLGYTRTFASATPENEPGLQVLLSVKYNILGMYSCLRFAGWQWDWQSRQTDEPLPILLLATG